MNMINTLGLIIKTIWALFANSVKTTTKTIWAVIKLAISNIRQYVQSSAEDRKLQAAAHVASIKIWAISIVLTCSTAFVVWSVFFATVGKLFGFLPVFALDAAGYLVVMILTGLAINTAERLGVRTDVVCNTRRIIEFVIDAMILRMVWICFCNPSDVNVLTLLSCYIAVAAYKRIQKGRTVVAASVPAPTQA